MDIGKIFEKVIKKLKVENSLQKTLKVNEKTLLTGDNSPFDSVALAQNLRLRRFCRSFN